MMNRTVAFVLMLLAPLSSAQTKSCGTTMEAVKDSVLILSDDFVDANTAQEKCSLMGGNLTMTGDPQINTTLTQLMTDKYTSDLQRVYIFYNPTDRYKYSNNSAEEGWISTKYLGHLWYFDLYKSNPENAMESINFCNYEKVSDTERWKVTVKGDCTPGNWVFQYSLFSDVNTSTHQKEIFNYWRESQPFSSKLRSVNESFETFNVYDGSFLEPDINVFIGARYNPSLEDWYWSDGSPANFSVSNVTTCQQGALHYGIGWEQSSMNCSGEPTYYACQVKFSATVEKTMCNASNVVVSWTGLDQIIEDNNLLAEVETYVLELNKKIMTPYADLSTTIENFSFATVYNFEITTMLTGCLNANVSTSTSVATCGNPPSSCYPPVNATAETFLCNASTVLVSWTGLDQFIINNELKAQVEIQLEGLNQTVFAPYFDYSTTIEDLIHSTTYVIEVTVIVTGSINTNIASNLTVTTPGNPPSSCYPEVNTTVETFLCNPSSVLVKWTGLDQFINSNDLLAQVQIRVFVLNQTISVPYSDKSTIIEDLLNSTLYDILVTVIVTGSINTNIASNLTVTTPPNPPPSCFPGENTANPATSVGMIAGLVIGLLLLILFIVGLVVMFIRRRHRKNQSSQPETVTAKQLFSLKRAEAPTTDKVADEDEYETVINVDGTNSNPTYETITKNQSRHLATVMTQKQFPRKTTNAPSTDKVADEDEYETVNVDGTNSNPTYETIT